MLAGSCWLVSAGPNPFGELAVTHWGALCDLHLSVEILCLCRLVAVSQTRLGGLTCVQAQVARRPQSVLSADNGGVVICCQV